MNSISHEKNADKDNSVRVITCSSSATVSPDCAGQVVVSGSYGGEYNAYYAAKWGIRGVVLCDAGGGKKNAGFRGLPYLDRIELPGATADSNTCHIADGEDVLEEGIISHVNQAASKLGCRVGQTVRDCTELMKLGPIVNREPAAIEGGKRYTLSEGVGEPKVVFLDAAPMLTPDDAGSIAVTGSHAALFRGRPDNMIGPDLTAIFFSDAGVGKDQAGIRRLEDLDRRSIPAGTASVESAEIGNSRDIYENGVLSFVNKSAQAKGARVGIKIKDFIDTLLASGKNTTS